MKQVTLYQICLKIKINSLKWQPVAYRSFKWPNQGDGCFRALNTRGPTRLGYPLHYPLAENRLRTFRYTENHVLGGFIIINLR